MTIYHNGDKVVYERLHTWKGYKIIKHNNYKWEVISDLMPRTNFDRLGAARTAIERHIYGVR